MNPNGINGITTALIATFNALCCLVVLFFVWGHSAAPGTTPNAIQATQMIADQQRDILLGILALLAGNFVIFAFRSALLSLTRSR